MTVQAQTIRALLKSADADHCAQHWTAARAKFRQAADLARNAGERWLLGYALRHLADASREDGDGTESLQAAQEAVQTYRSLPDATALDLANALRLTALAQEALGLGAAAAPSWREARILYDKVQVDEGVAECGRRLALIEDRP
jgi:hypothetical protein